HRVRCAAARRTVRARRWWHGTWADEVPRSRARRGGIRHLHRARTGARAAGDAQYRRRVRQSGCRQRDERQIDHEQGHGVHGTRQADRAVRPDLVRSEEHTSELQSLRHLVCRLLLEKKKKKKNIKKNKIKK